PVSARSTRVRLGSNGSSSDNVPDKSRSAQPSVVAIACLPALDVLKQVLEERLELPAHTLRESDHLLRDLHLNSLSIGQIVAESARRLGLPRPASPTEYAHATLGEAARTLEELRSTGFTAPGEDV